MLTKKENIGVGEVTKVKSETLKPFEVNPINNKGSLKSKLRKTMRHNREKDLIIDDEQTLEGAAP